MAVAVAVAVAVASAAAQILGERGDSFEERPVTFSALAEMARDEVLAHGGGRCFVQRPTVFRCLLVESKQAHEGGGGRQWCFDSDGPQTLSMSRLARRRASGDVENDRVAYPNVKA